MSAATEAAPARAGARGWAVVGVPCLAIGLVYAVIFVVPPLISPVFVDRLGFSHGQAGLLMTFYTAAYTVSSLPAGALADRVGPGRVLAAGLTLAAASSLAFSLTESFGAQAGLRLLLGVATGLVYTAGVGLMRSELTESQMQTGVGVLLAALNVGIAVAYFGSPLLESQIGWEWTFRVVGFACLLGLPALALLRHGAAARPAAPAPPGRIGLLVRDPVLLGLAGSLFLTMFVLYGILTWVPSFWADEADFGASALSFAALAVALAGIPGSILAGAAAGRSGRPLAVAAAGLVLSLPVLAVAAVPGDAVLGTAFAVAAAFGISAAAIPLFALPSVARPADAAAATGLVTTAGMGGAMLATYLGGVLVESWGYGAAFGMFAAAAAAGAFVAVPLTSVRMRSAPAPTATEPSA